MNGVADGNNRIISVCIVAVLAVSFAGVMGYASMNALTAVAMLLGGVSLWLHRRPGAAATAAQICADGMALIGALALGERALGQPLRMSLVTAADLVLCGVALLALSRRARHTTVQTLIVPVGSTTLLSLASQMYSVSALERVAQFEAMSLASTIALALLSTGILFATPDAGLVAALRGRGLAGRLARRIIPAVFLVPLVVGWLRLWAERIGLYTPEFGIALFSVVTIVVLVLVIWWNVNSLAALEAAQQTNNLEIRRQRDALQRQAELIDSSNDAIIVADSNRVIMSWNGGAQKLYGWTEQEASGKVLHELLQTTCPTSIAAITDELRRNKHWEGEMVQTCRNGQTVTVDSRQVLLPDTAASPGGMLEINRDITDRKRLEGQLFQSQKLESLGRLAGGVAHDFNNILAVVIGYSEMVLEELPKGDPFCEPIGEISKAGQRATALTRQLLLFSHRQMDSPVNLVLSDAVRNLEKMLRRVIREDIEMILLVDDDRTIVHADPGYIEQVLLNLVINSRDAMPDGGRLVIETSHTIVTEQYVDSHFDVMPGEYALLTVSDTGCGMTLEVKERIFEPFFTTKEQGKGTGLGLATVYGIVKQSGGSIFVYSEVGHGTTFKIFLPAVKGAVEKREAAPVKRDLTGTETIMLVEDEDALRKLISEGLRRNGYTVIVNANGREALDVCRSYEGQIDLLLSDVVMPEMNGPDLAAAFKTIRPGVPILLMYGYTDRGPKDITGRIISKPFTLSDLMSEIRSLLE